MDFALQHGFKLADLEVHPLRGEVVRPDGLVHIQPKAMEVLVCLAEKTLQTVTRNELIREVWGISTEHDSHAEDNLTRCVSELRHALGDSPTDPRYIKTLPRVGYRLVEVPHLIDRSADMAFGYDPYLEDDPPPDSVPNGLDVAGNSAALRHAHGPVTKPGWSIDRILGEMQRRRVFRVAVAFPVIAWGFLEVADLLMEKIVALPEATQTVVMQMLFVFLVLGYSLALYLAWITQLTPAGMRVEPGAHIPAIFQKGRLGWVSGGILMLVVTSIVIAIRFVGSERQAAEACPATIGVMPFANFSPSPSDDYLGRALSEEIAHLLATTGRLKVASRTAAFSLDTTDLSMQDIGERLGVCNVLEGSVRRQGDKLRITAQLIDAGTGYHAWSGTFDRQVSDLFVVHDEISRAVIRALGGSTEGAVQMTLVKHSTSSLDAYEHYLQGRSILAKADDEERMLRADALFRRSLE
ncbi:MAG: winged helix-turn-helix domain-containing protein, partial [Gammaproteobacteria bacterium]